MAVEMRRPSKVCPGYIPGVTQSSSGRRYGAVGPGYVKRWVSVSVVAKKLPVVSRVCTLKYRHSHRYGSEG